VKRIVIVDAGIGNLRSVQKAFEHVGAAPSISDDPVVVAKADAVVLPGVGAFGDGMDGLRAHGLDRAVCKAIGQGLPFFGICVGLQLLFEESEEMGVHRGLGVLPGRVVRFPAGLTVPHMGWNQIEQTRASSLEPAPVSPRPEPATKARPEGSVEPTSVSSVEPTSVSPRPEARPEGSVEPHQPHPLLTGVLDGAFAYFAHSYHVVADDESIVVATTEYGGPFPCAVARDNVWAIQFHPEKSQQVGLRILKNFVSNLQS
jgi:glutamine amidotransferase